MPKTGVQTAIGVLATATCRARWAGAAALALLGAGSGLCSQAEAPVSLRSEVLRLSQEARDAQQAGDHATYLERAERLTRIVPNNPRAWLALARASALSGRPADAVRALKRLAAMGVGPDLDKEPDLGSLAGTPGFPGIQAALAAHRVPVANATVAFTIADRELLTEGIAYDPRAQAFLVSSVHRGKALRLKAGAEPRNFATSPREGFGLLALAVDAERGSLWASSPALPQVAGYRQQDKGRSCLVEFDLETGRVRRTLDSPQGVGAVLGDIVAGPGGVIHASDMAQGGLYVLRPGGAALEALIQGEFLSPQGLAWSADRRWLFVADYVLGIACVDPQRGKVRFLEAPEDVALYGIDGLIEAGTWLVGIQNGIEPNRVVALRLDQAANRILELRVLDRAHPSFAEPTLGVRVGEDLYYVGASQWGCFGDDGSVVHDRLLPPVILRTSLASLDDAEAPGASRGGGPRFPGK